jgi:uncharacterized membrane protein (UPF0182 family)
MRSPKEHNMRFRIWPTAIILILLVLAFGGSLVRLYIDWLWFGELGYQVVFWKELKSKLELGLAAGILFFLIVYSNLWLARRLSPPATPRYDRGDIRIRISNVARKGIGYLIFISVIAVSILVAWEASSHWMSYQKFLHPTSFGDTDPIFGKDIGFYIFQFDFLKYIYGWLMFTFIVAAIATTILHYVDRAIEIFAGKPTFAPHVKAHLSILLAAVLFVRAWGYWLDRYDLLYSAAGVVYGAGYTDVHARLAALSALSVAAVIAGVLALVNIYRRGIILPTAAIAALIATSILLGTVYPGLIQQFRVKPNELDLESKYIKYNIAGTRKAFDLEKVEVKNFPAPKELTAEDIRENQATINSIRLWDYRPLQSTYNQLQSLGPYYLIENVDIDRYVINGELRQVMLAARELSDERIAERAGQWVNRFLQYTHGYGVVMSPVNRATPEGLPEFFIKDMPPVSSVGINIRVPQIYYGEFTTNYVIARSKQKEYDFQSEAGTGYTRYKGNGGFPIGGFLRRALLAWRFSDINILLSNQITPNSRFMFRRQIRDRVSTIAPFLRFDHDPYLVVSEGKLYWIWDAYTVSSRYPYSSPYSSEQVGTVNYIRNTVKVVIDAYNGSVDFYAAEDEPIIRTYKRIFPGVFKPLSAMPKDLRAHIRYPELLFAIQTEVLRTYHMLDPQVFFNKSDLWDIPTEIVETFSEEQEIEPYYVVMKLPEEAKESFLLMRPFTPHSKKNMVAWMAAKCDPEDYGRMILYKFPEGSLVYGPAMIEARINQDDTISQQLTLWNASGSRVNRGNQLVIPIDQSVIYVKPLYLQSEQSQIPELKRVIVAYGERLAMEPTLDAALARLFGSEVSPKKPSAPQPASAASASPYAVPASDIQRLAKQAMEQYQRAQQYLRDGNWASYGEEMKRLEQTLRQLDQKARGK